MLGFGQLPLADVVRQAIYGRLARYEDVNDAERLFPSKIANASHSSDNANLHHEVWQR